MNTSGQSLSRNLRLNPLDYAGHENSFWRLKIFERFEAAFDVERFEANLKTITFLAQNDFRYAPFSIYYQTHWDIYKIFINDFKRYFVDSSTLLSKTIPFVDNRNTLTLTEAGELVRNKIHSSSQSWVMISDDHRISHATIQELTHQYGTKTIVIVIDNHADIYGSAPAKNIPLKFNPFRHLIESHSIEHVMFLCPQFTEILNDQKTWLDISKDISLVPFRVEPTSELTFDQESFEPAFADIVKRKQIQNIFFSIDIDALVDPSKKTLYTAFEYSILNSLLYLSSISGDRIQSFDSLSNATARLKNIVTNGRVPAREVKLRNPYQPNLNTVNEIGISQSVYIETIKTVAKLARSMNVTVGLGSCFGEVVELWGPDWQGATTDAVLELVKTLNNL